MISLGARFAGWVENLRTEDIAAIDERFASSCSLAEDFRQRFGDELDEDSLNQSHQSRGIWKELGAVGAKVAAVPAGRPTRRNNSWKRGSSRKPSILGSK
jgi:hypothetical protein